MTSFKLQVVPPNWKRSTVLHGHTYSQVNEVIDARWNFDDGVEVHVRQVAEVVTWVNGRYDGRTHARELTRKARVYVSGGEPFNVMEDLTNRRRRPHTLWKPRVIDALRRIGIDAKLNWSQHAGCSCGCSPGFVLTSESRDLHGLDVWVTLPNAPTVDEMKPARELV